MIIIVAKQLGKLNPIDYSAKVSHALNCYLRKMGKRYFTKIFYLSRQRNANFVFIPISFLECGARLSIILDSWGKQQHLLKCSSTLKFRRKWNSRNDQYDPPFRNSIRNTRVILASRIL